MDIMNINVKNNDVGMKCRFILIRELEII